MKVQLLLLVSVCALAQAQFIPGLIRDAFRDQMKKTIIECTQEGGITHDTFRETMRSGKVPEEWGCIYKCIMQGSPIPMMSQNGDIMVPFFAPDVTKQCIESSTSGKDLCRNAWMAATCFINTRDIIKKQFGINPKSDVF